ncbi:hypothetical protein PIB30_001597 [Stylosanthes scabra]|uniref:Uncharacterized protein n=1 Tax=Stylosanthes scabra TaxID=79078 RepID=A0ABU6S274_9FABA|nr:hypothetical protein [Stylosanthes scabra]
MSSPIFRTLDVMHAAVNTKKNQIEVDECSEEDNIEDVVESNLQCQKGYQEIKETEARLEASELSRKVPGNEKIAIRKNFVDFLGIIETKKSQIELRLIRSVWNVDNGTAWEFVEAENSSGGLLYIWNSDFFTVPIL